MFLFITLFLYIACPYITYRILQYKGYHMPILAIFLGLFAQIFAIISAALLPSKKVNRKRNNTASVADDTNCNTETVYDLNNFSNNNLYSSNYDEQYINQIFELDDIPLVSDTTLLDRIRFIVQTYFLLLLLIALLGPLSSFMEKIFQSIFDINY